MQIIFRGEINCSEDNWDIGRFIAIVNNVTFIIIIIMFIDIICFVIVTIYFLFIFAIYYFISIITCIIVFILNNGRIMYTIIDVVRMINIINNDIYERIIVVSLF